MKRIALISVLFFLFPLALFSEEKDERIQHFQLNTERIFMIPVYLTSGVTTVMFPAEIESIHAANVAMNQIPQGANPAFLLAYTPGSYYFSIRALRKGADGFVNIIYGGKAYILYCHESDEKAFSSVSFKGGNARGGGVAGRPQEISVSPYLLKSCLDKAKAWEVLKKKDNFSTSEIEVNNQVYESDYDTYSCKIQRIWRFSRYDVLVFYIVLKNKTDKVLYYNPREVALGVADKKCFSALADASGEMPPKSETIMFSVVTGTHDGIRKLSPVNNWRIHLFASEKKPQQKNL